MTWLDLTPEAAEHAIAAWVGARGLDPYRTRQVLPYLWQRPAPEWLAATDLPRALVLALDEACPLPRPERAATQRWSDGTVKFLWRNPDGSSVESVLIPEGRRRTLCISSQAGCAFGCAFCATGRMGFGRNLSPSEIVAQVRELVLDPELGRPSNIVFMGMGEPLHNWAAVDTALTILNDPRGLGIAARQITVSTVGLVPGLEALARRPEQFGVAWSLHSPFSDRRGEMLRFETAEEPHRTHPSEILLAHPKEKFGCTSCHGGQGWAVDTAAAHGQVAHWEEPLLSRALGEDYTLAGNKGALMQMNCNVCHRYDRETRGADAINLGKKLVLDKGCRACHVINKRGGTIGPDLTYVGDKAPEQYDYGRLSGSQITAFAWHVAHLKDHLGMSLSGGERRRVEIARALAANPSLILLHDPFAGVDPLPVHDLQRIARHLADRGIGVLITDHNVRETLGIFGSA